MLTENIKKEIKSEMHSYWLQQRRTNEVYGRENICFNENSIVVTIPYDRLGDEVYAPGHVKNILDVTANGIEIPPVRAESPNQRR